MAMEKQTEEVADERTEAAIASSATLGPTFKPKSGLTESQLAKFQELHKRRLLIKARSKSHQRDKGDGKTKPQKKSIGARDCAEPIKPLVPQSKMGNFSSLEEAGNSTSNKRQKLFWGLDAKERWERKSNM